jgi:hypothetical protein
MDQIKMKKTALAVTLVAALGLAACSSNKTVGLAPPSDSQTAVKDTTISTEFRDQGIRIYYTLLGNLDRIEVYGQAPAWKGNVEIVAEADAMDKLVKFIHGQTVSTERRVQIMARSMDRARDNTMNQFRSADGTINFDSADLDKPLPALDNEGERSNTSRRVADRVENTLVRTVNTITSKGRLTGVRKIRDEVINDGRNYVAVYQWSEKDQATSEFIRGRMR